MTFLDWMRMSMVVDISFVVFASYCIWKLRMLNKKIERYTQETRSSFKDSFEDMELTVYRCAKNPRLAKTLLKEKQK